MERFWADVLDAYPEGRAGGLPLHRLLRCLPASQTSDAALPEAPSPSRFSEKRFLTCTNTVNVLLFDAVFRELTGGLHPYRGALAEFVDRNDENVEEENGRHYPSPSPRRLLSFNDILQKILLQCTRLVVIATSPAHDFGVLVQNGKKAYDEVLARRGDAPFLKLGLLRRIARRFSPTLDASRFEALVRSVAQLPLPAAYSRLCHESPFVVPVDAKDSKQLLTAFHEIQDTVLSRLPGGANTTASSLLRAITARLGENGTSQRQRQRRSNEETRSDDDAEKNEPTVYEHVVRTFVRDGYFLRKAMRTQPLGAPVVDGLWFRCLYTNGGVDASLPSAEEEWCKLVLRSRVVSTRFKMVESREEDSDDAIRSTTQKVASTCLEKLWGSLPRITLRVTEANDSNDIDSSRSHDVPDTADLSSSSTTTKPYRSVRSSRNAGTASRGDNRRPDQILELVFDPSSGAVGRNPVDLGDVLPDCAAKLSSRWWLDLCAKVIQTRVAPPQPQDQVHQMKSMFLDFVFRYARKHDLVNLRWTGRSANDGCGGGEERRTDASALHSSSNLFRNAIVLIDNRSDSPLGMVSVLMALHNLGLRDDGKSGADDGHDGHDGHGVDSYENEKYEDDWGVFVFCGDNNAAYVEKCLRPHVPASRSLKEQDGTATSSRLSRDRLNIVVLDELCATNAFSIEDYNTLMKKPSFWRQVRADKCLMIQDDGMLVKPGARRFVEAYDYVGAPWLEGQVKLAEASSPELVGNGGLSVRNVRAMLEIAEESEARFTDEDLFINGFQPIPEDVFFAHGMNAKRHAYRLAPREEAARFSCEQVLTRGSLGFHKPWPYTTAADMKAWFEEVLAGG